MAGFCTLPCAFLVPAMLSTSTLVAAEARGPPSRRGLEDCSDGDPGGDDVKELVERLCWSLLLSVFQGESDGVALSVSLRPRFCWNTRRKQRELRTLLHRAYDILLLRKWVWFGNWTTPLSPVCECVAYGYECYHRGQHWEGERLNRCLQAFLETSQRRQEPTTLQPQIFISSFSLYLHPM